MDGARHYHYPHDPSGNGLEWTLEHRDKSAKNEITAPRIKAYPYLSRCRRPDCYAERSSRVGAQRSEKGADGIKFLVLRPMCSKPHWKKQKRKISGTACHHARWTLPVQMRSNGALGADLNGALVACRKRYLKTERCKIIPLTTIIRTSSIVSPARKALEASSKAIFRRSGMR